MNSANCKSFLAAVLAMGCLGTPPARADGPYAGGGLGMPHFQDNVNGVSGSGAGLSGKLYGGYQFTPAFGLEAGAADLGHPNNGTGNLAGHSVFVDAVGTLHLSDKWALLGRIGVAHVNLNTSNGDASGNGMKVGAGAQYALNSQVSLRAEWERYHPSEFGGNPNIDQVSFGLRFAF